MTESVQPTARAVTAATAAALADGELVTLARRGEAAAFGEIMRRNNRRLFRAARGVLRDDAEAEDAVQEAYLHAFQGLAGFRGDSALSTWLTRITLNEAFGRLRRRRATAAVVVPDPAAGTRQGAPVLPFPGSSHAACGDPEGAAARNEVRRLLNEAIDELPEPFRAVFVLREVEEASVEEAAGLLGLRLGTVRTRLHRARRLLRVALDDRRQEEGPTHRGPPSPAAEALRPPIVLSVPDHERLIMLAGTVAGRSPRVARLLLEETGRAAVVPAERLPIDVVAVGSLVEFRDAGSRATQRVRLVLPAAANIGEGRISVLSLVGAGLVGLATGQSIDWPTLGGRMRRLSILRVDPVGRSAAAAALLAS